MRKIFISCMTVVLSLVMVFSVSAPGAFAKTTKQYAYSGSYFGDSMNKVKKINKSKHYSQDGNNLYVNSSSLGYKATVAYEFSKNKLSAVYVVLKLPKEYYTWGQIKYLHNQIYPKLKKALNTKSKGFTYGYDSYDHISTLWNFKTRDVFFTVGNSDWDYINAGIAYLPPSK